MIYRMTKLLLAVSKMNHVNPVNPVYFFPLSLRSALA
ncbi:MAG: hypothetical protein QOI77_3642 [Blastocatellia bacterium]|nr:hypothetical protein [Blastocatellia bacterium]